MGILIRKELGKGALLGVWKIEEDEDWYFSNPLLTERVQIRIDAYKSVQRKLQGIAVRILIKNLLPQEDNVDIDYDEKSKPFFVSLKAKISVTHSEDMVAVLISDQGEVGVDIEKCNTKVKRIFHKFMNEMEYETYISLKDPGKTDYLHIIWGAKESLYKLYGKGNLDFRKHLLVREFKLKSEGDFVGVIDKDDKMIKVDGYYSKVGKFVLVYVLEKVEHLAV